MGKRSSIKRAVRYHTAYIEADHRTRRQINQAIFERLLISDGGCLR